MSKQWDIFTTRQVVKALNEDQRQQNTGGYHLREIEKGTYGETSKIQEELEELEDALEQNNWIMAMVELSDLYGAIEGVAAKLGVSMEHVIVMSQTTKRAFESGDRE